jgi:hypothetical protein
MNPTNEELRNYVKETFFHELDRLSQRTNWFLIFHAALLTAFVSCKDGVLYIIPFLGILTSYLWFMNGMRCRKALAQVGFYMENLNIMGNSNEENIDKPTPNNIADMHKRLFDDRKKLMNDKPYSWASDVPTFAVAVPALWFLAWEAIAWHYFCFCYVALSFVAIVMLSALIHSVSFGWDKTKEEMQKITKSNDV